MLLFFCFEIWYFRVSKKTLMYCFWKTAHPSVFIFILNSDFTPNTIVVNSMILTYEKLLILLNRCSWGCPTNIFVINSVSQSVIIFLPIFKTLPFSYHKSMPRVTRQTSCHLNFYLFYDKNTTLFPKGLIDRRMSRFS